MDEHRGPTRVELPVPLAVVVLLIVVVTTALLVTARGPASPADLTLWTFSAAHAAALRQAGPSGEPSVIERFQQRFGKRVNVELMTPRSLDLRLTTLLRSGSTTSRVPDVVEVESMSAAKFLDAPADEIVLTALDERLEHGGVGNRVLASRLDTWRRGGRLYGMPMDVHPVALAYRRDLFDEAGVDPSGARTWSDLKTALQRYVAYWHGRGVLNVRPLELSRSRSDHLTLMLQQRGVGLIDAQGGPELTDPLLGDTILFYASLVAGKSPVATATSDGYGRWAREFAAGDVAMVWMPDWRLGPLMRSAPQLAGRVALMPLPTFDDGDAPTAVWGGTMLAIPKGTRDPMAAWALLEFVGVSEEALAARRRTSHILPPLPAMWNRENDREGDLDSSGYFRGQSINASFAQLAQYAKPERITPLKLAIWAHLAAIVSRAVGFLENGGDADALARELPSWLAAAEEDLRRRAAFYRADRGDPVADADE